RAGGGCRGAWLAATAAASRRTVPPEAGLAGLLDVRLRDLIGGFGGGIHLGKAELLALGGLDGDAAGQQRQTQDDRAEDQRGSTSTRLGHGPKRCPSDARGASR